jgi:RNA polymerase sigma-70 factor (ECF subfamily)
VSPHLSRPKPDLRVIFDEHFDYVWLTLRRLGVRDGDLEDLAHEVFLKVHGRLADYDPSRPLRPWLFGFAYRIAADHRRLARHRLEVLGAPAEAIDPGLPADDQLVADEERELVDVALDSVHVDRRAVLLLHDVDDVPVPAIAEELGIPVNTAYSRLRLARDELAAAYARLRRTRAMKTPKAGRPAKRGGAL